METRPIKFRMWSTITKSMSPVADWKQMILTFANQHKENKDPNLTEKSLGFITMMQYTGLNDAFGKEIYEGDIIRSIVDGKYLTGVMEWKPQQAQFGMEVDKSELMMGDYIEKIEIGYPPEIIGNVFENPELIAKKQ